LASPRLDQALPAFKLYPVETLAQAVSACQGNENPLDPQTFPNHLVKTLKKWKPDQELMPLQPGFQKNPWRSQSSGIIIFYCWALKAPVNVDPKNGLARLRPPFSRELLLERALLSELNLG